MEQQLTWLNFYKHNRFWRHAILWLMYLLFWVFNFIAFDIGNEEGEFITWVPLFIFNLELLLLIYCSFYAYNKLIPEKKFAAFAGLMALFILITAFIDGALGIGVIQLGALKGFWANLLTLPIFLSIAFGIKLAYGGARQLLVIERLKNKQTESELKLLRSQINPHFLFNTLNNIYSTNLDEHEKANEIILKLADLLRYQLESGKKNTSLLKEEVNSLKSYITLEQIRVRNCEINIEEHGDYGNAEIVPLLLLPFVENAFKYGTGILPGQIDIKFSFEANRLFTFYCRNKIVQSKGKLHSGGIGISNTCKRLELMYPDTHELEMGEKDGIYELRLKIQL